MNPLQRSGGWSAPERLGAVSHNVALLLQLMC